MRPDLDGSSWGTRFNPQLATGFNREAAPGGQGDVASRLNVEVGAGSHPQGRDRTTCIGGWHLFLGVIKPPGPEGNSMSPALPPDASTV